MSHNGYTNYETWAVHLWLTNDEATYNFCCSLAADALQDAETCPHVREGIWQPEEAPTYLLSDRLKEYVQEGSPLANAPSMYSDLLNAALSEVNWHEIAEAFLEE